MKKLIILLSFFFLTGCGILNATPKETVNNFFNKYKTNNESVVEELDFYLETEDYSKEIKEKYKKAYLRQYSNIEYDIKSVDLKDNSADLYARITVYDYYDSSEEASQFFLDNQDSFLNESGNLDLDKYMNYKIESLLDTTSRRSYDLKLKLVKKDLTWDIEPLDEEQLLKLHGMYNE